VISDDKCKDIVNIYFDLLNGVLSKYNNKIVIEKKRTITQIISIGECANISDRCFLRALFLCKEFDNKFEKWDPNDLYNSIALFLNGWVCLEQMFKNPNKKNIDNVSLIKLIMLLLTYNNTSDKMDYTPYWQRINLYQLLDHIKQLRNQIVHGGAELRFIGIDLHTRIHPQPEWRGFLRDVW